MEEDEAPREAPSPGPDLYIDPINQPELKLESPQVTSTRFAPAPLWDDALDGFGDDGPSSFRTDLTVTFAPLIEPEGASSTHSSALAAGLAIAFWTNWEFHARRHRSDRRRWMLPLS